MACISPQKLDKPWQWPEERGAIKLMADKYKADCVETHMWKLKQGKVLTGVQRKSNKDREDYLYLQEIVNKTLDDHMDLEKLRKYRTLHNLRVMEVEHRRLYAHAHGERFIGHGWDVSTENPLDHTSKEWKHKVVSGQYDRIYFNEYTDFQSWPPSTSDGPKCIVAGECDCLMAPRRDYDNELRKRDAVTASLKEPIHSKLKEMNLTNDE